MTKRELNQELAKVGRRICEDCGANHALGTVHFYRNGNGYLYVCIPCWRFRENEKFNRRYREDAEFRAHAIARSAAHHAAHRDAHNARQRRYAARLRDAKPVKPLLCPDARKRAAFQRILAEVQP